MDRNSEGSVVTTEPSEFISITKDDFNALLKNNYDMAMVIMRGLVKRLREADKKIESLALMDVYGRVARVLLDFSEATSEGRVVKSKMPRQDIAKMIGASREMVSRVMKGLEERSMIETLADGSVLVKPGLALA